MKNERIKVNFLDENKKEGKFRDFILSKIQLNIGLLWFQKIYFLLYTFESIVSMFQSLTLLFPPCFYFVRPWL